MRPSPFWLSLLALSAPLLGADGCADVDNDADGVTVEDGDCDDNNSLVYPEAPETCDGLDNSCDGVVDNDPLCYEDNAPTGLYFPPTDAADTSWQTTSAAALGWNEAGLQAVIDYAQAQNSTGFVVLYRGRIMVERYWSGWQLHTAAKIYSAGKSVVALMVGQAQQAGALQISDAMTGCLGAGWSQATPEQEGQISLTDLLTMTSGLDTQLGYQAPPGTEWLYNTDAYYTLQDCMAARYEVGMDTLGADLLFEPTGMADSSWVEEDHQMKASTRDMARFGLLVLAGGQWNGQPLINDSTYFEAMLSPNQDLNPAYGYLWWLNGQSSFELPDGEPGQGWLLPTAPEDLVAALGAADKKIYVVPSMELVVVRHGPAADESAQGTTAFDAALWRLIMAAAP